MVRGSLRLGRYISYIACIEGCVGRGGGGGGNENMEMGILLRLLTLRKEEGGSRRMANLCFVNLSG